MLDPYDGKVKCIFLDDDQEPLSRKGGGRYNHQPPDRQAQRAGQLPTQNATSNIQSKNRGSMQPPSLEKRVLLRSEILQEITTAAENLGLQTVDEAAAEDEATGFIPAL